MVLRDVLTICLFSSCRIPRLPMMVPRAVVAMISPVGVTRFCSAMGVTVAGIADIRCDRGLRDCRSSATPLSLLSTRNDASSGHANVSSSDCPEPAINSSCACGDPAFIRNVGGPDSARRLNVSRT